MFVVKRLGRNGMWNAVSLIDENGSFRGEAKFEAREQADEYLQVYMLRMKERLRTSSNPEPQVKVFDDSTPEAPPVEIKETTIKRKKVHKKSKKKKIIRK